jgi:hypothetical protein
MTLRRFQLPILLQAAFLLYHHHYYHHTTTIIIIIIKIADNITAIPLMELCSTGCSEVTIRILNDEWATCVMENLLLMDVTCIRGRGEFNVLFPQNVTQ